MKNNGLMFIFLIIIFLGFISAGNMITGSAVENVDGKVSVRLVYVLAGSILMASGIFLFHKRKRAIKRHENKLLILLWFSGITGFFLVLGSIFIAMTTAVGHEKIIFYEPSHLIFWSEFILLFFVAAVTLWILYNYVSGRGALVILRKTA